MNRSLSGVVLGLALVSSLAACKKQEAATGGGAGATPTATTVAPKAFAGPLTMAVMSSSARAVNVYTPDGKPAPFAGALAEAKAAMGEPTHVNGTTYAWGLVDGDKCSYYRLVDKDGMATSPGTITVDKADGDCLAAIGLTPPPPASGSSFAAAVADDLCSVIAKVIAASTTKFGGMDPTVKPHDATKVAVTPAAGPSPAAWSAEWESTGTPAERLAPIKARVMACDFGKDLVGDGQPHATEKDGPANAIDWTLAAPHLGIEIMAEGASGVTLSIAAQ